MNKIKLFKRVLVAVLCESLFLILAAAFALFLSALWFSDGTPLFIWIPDARLALLAILIVYFSVMLAGFKLKSTILKKSELSWKVLKFLSILNFIAVAILMLPTLGVLIKTLIKGGY
jgi:peptidoglycan/LPS O-acetylase OafA/YrhL